MANQTSMNDPTPGRRDRDPDNEAHKKSTSPNKSQLDSDEVDSVAVRANDQGDDKNLGDRR